MLRGLAVGLLAANLLFWAWTQGWLTSLVGIDPRGDREPQRVASQVAPDSITLRPVGSPATSAPETSARTLCLEAGPFTGAESTRIEALARSSFPEATWAVVKREKPGSWMIYMGRYPGRDALQRKADELRRLNVAFEELRGFPDLEPGFVFGRYNQLADAQEAVRRLAGQRIRTARIVQLAPPSSTESIRLPQADAALQATAADLRPQLAGRGFAACRD